MKKKDQDLDISRRQFVRQSACAGLGCTALVNSLAQLTLVKSAVAQTAPTGYKALVVVFLAGGNDSFNMLLPRIGHPSYNIYKSSRGVLGIYDQNDGSPSSNERSIPITTPDGNYGLHPKLPGIANLFNSGELAFVANVGSLCYPVLTRQAYFEGVIPVPNGLFSHEGQQLQWQSSLPDRPFQSGWGGRIADLLTAGSSNAVSMNISLSGINRLQMGLNVPQYSLYASGTVPLEGYNTNYSWALNPDGTYKDTVQGRRLRAFEQIMSYTHANLHEEAYNGVVRNARNNEDLFGAAQVAASASGVDFNTLFSSAQNELGLKLKMIAKLIAGRASLGNNRQIFFATSTGYDTHSAQLGAHSQLMNELSTSLVAFRNALQAIGVYDDVLTITASDFGRTLIPNKLDTATAGSDHGWGGNQIVMGGAVNGGRIYGSYPTLITGSGLDTFNRGQYIPTTSVDQYAAVASRWFGVGNSEMATIFPNLHRFDDPFGGTANLGYV